MKTKFVTSFYGYHNGPPLWGELNRGNRYKHSLKTICGMGTEVVCYTDIGHKGFDELTSFKDEHNIENLTIKIYPILDNPYQERVYNIRMDETFEYNSEIYDHNSPKIQFPYTRSPQIYFMKFHFLEMEFEPNINLYWIDCGLCHSGMFPSNLSTHEQDLKPDVLEKSPEWKSYTYDLAFTPETVEVINNRADGKMMLMCRRNITDCNYPNFFEAYGEHLQLNNLYPSGGVFGGSTDNLLEFTQESKDIIDIALNKKKYLFGDEEILGSMKAKHPDWFNCWQFETYWHEELEYYRNGISFYKFFLNKT